MIKIAHVSSVHSRYDTRILFNQCASLSCKYDTTYFVCDGQSDELRNGVNIKNCYIVEGRIRRIFYSMFVLIFYVWDRDIKLYHLHDPELFLLAIMLKITGKKVIFDVHEDYSVDIRNKSWLNSHVTGFIVLLYKVIFDIVFRICDEVITVTEKIQAKIDCSAKLIKNYPNTERFRVSKDGEKKYSAIYVGSISLERGIQSILKLDKKFSKPIALAGNFADLEAEKLVSKEVRSGNVVYLGFIVPDKVPEIMSSASIGVHLVSNNVNLLSGLPIKIFEYIASGLPVICSRSVAWENYFNEFSTVHFVDPQSTREIESAVKACEAVTIEMLRESRLLLGNKYSWTSQSIYLLNIYDKIFS